jgi:hypothetical protein
MDSTIKVKPTTKEALEALKVHPRETYEDVILRLVDFYKKNVKEGEIGHAKGSS